MNQYPPVNQDILDAIKNCSGALICGHKNPDGDCANSVLAMGFLCHKLGKPYLMINDGDFGRPEIVGFEQELAKTIPQSFINEETLGIVVDCSSPDRLGTKASFFSNLKVAVIDHHSSGKDFGSYHYIVPTSPSSSLLVLKVFQELGIEPDDKTAKQLFRGFATDSGFFRFLNTNCGDTLRLVAQLADHNVSPHDEYYVINGGRSLQSVRFLATMIERTESLYGGKLMVSHEELSDLQTFGSSSRSSDDLYAQLLSVKNVQAVVFFKQSHEKGAIEVGFRAAHDSNIDVGETAASLGGGGHKKAAGVTLNGSYEFVRAKVIQALSKYF